MPFPLPVSAYAPLQDGRRNIFFAILINAPVSKDIRQLELSLRSEKHLGGKAVRQLHISLVGLGSHIGVPQGVQFVLDRAASSIKQRAFRVRLDQAMSFKHQNKTEHPFVLCGSDGVVGLDFLHRELVYALRHEGGKHLSTAFNAHMTLLYDRQLVPNQTIDAVEFEVEDFVLVQQPLYFRNNYTELGRWPLRNRPSW